MRAPKELPRGAFAWTPTVLRTALTLLALGCAPPPPPDACLDTTVDLHAPETGCTVLELAVAGDASCAFDDAQTVTGTWLRLHHRADRFTTLRLRAISIPSACDASGETCPMAHVTRGGAVPCACDSEGLDWFSFPVARRYDVPLFAPEQAVLLRPAGASYEVSICVDDREPFPTCHDAAACFSFTSLHEGGGCACLPTCRVDDDCPQPRTGTVRARCEPIGCTLPCGPDDVCPGEQTCLDPEGTAGPICMVSS